VSDDRNSPVTAADLDAFLAHLMHLLREYGSCLTTIPLASAPSLVQLLTLEKMGAMVHRSKRSMERFRKKMPPPRGKISGGLETLDFETLAIFECRRQKVATHCPGQVARLCLVLRPGQWSGSWSATTGHLRTAAWEVAGSNAQKSPSMIAVGGERRRPW
jgi:hypothetical protein